MVFENSLGRHGRGGRATSAGDPAHAASTPRSRASATRACAYAFLAGKEHRFGRGFQVNGLLIPVAARPRPEDSPAAGAARKRRMTLAEFTAAPAEPESAGAPKERWQPGQGVLFTSTPTLFGRVYNSFYCDGTQGRDTSRCELLSDADPYKLGVLTP